MDIENSSIDDLIRAHVAAGNVVSFPDGNEELTADADGFVCEIWVPIMGSSGARGRCHAKASSPVEALQKASLVVESSKG